MAWVVICDDNSAAVYEWVDSASGAAGAQAGELTLVGTIDNTVVIDDITFYHMGC